MLIILHPTEGRGIFIRNNILLQKYCKKHKVIIILLIALVAIITISFVFFMTNVSDPVVATVNGEPITSGELALMMGKYRADTIVYYYNTFGLEYDDKFWETQEQNVAPAEYLRKKALESIIDRKIQQIYLRDNGIISDFSYKSFKRDYENENKRRQDAKEQSGTVYGVQAFDELAYYEYVFINQVQNLLDTRGETLFAVNEDDILRYYEENAINFMLPDEITVEVVFVMDQEGVDSYTRIMEADGALLSGMDFRDVMLRYNDSGKPMEVELSKSTILMYDSVFVDVAYALDESKISDPLSWDNGWGILRCVKRITDIVSPLEDNINSIQVECIQEKYQEQIDSLREGAVIKINENVLERVTIWP